MNEIRNLMNDIVAFSEERDWDQFHSPENLAKSIVIEAGELPAAGSKTGPGSGEDRQEEDGTERQKVSSRKEQRKKHEV